VTAHQRVGNRPSVRPAKNRRTPSGPSVRARSTRAAIAGLNTPTMASSPGTLAFTQPRSVATTGPYAASAMTKVRRTNATAWPGTRSPEGVPTLGRRRMPTLSLPPT
jgi:hypothetical protein